MRIAPPLPSLPLSPVVPQGRAVSSPGSARQASADHGAADVLALSPDALRFGGFFRKNADQKLREAACNGDIDRAMALLQKGANIEEKGKYGQTALMRAAYNDHPEMVELLLNKGANIEAQDNEGDTALSGAVILGKVRTAGVLLDRGANIV